MALEQAAALAAFDAYSRKNSVPFIGAACDSFDARYEPRYRDHLKANLNNIKALAIDYIMFCGRDE